ncbi:MAG: amidohydrolase family protein [Acidobacteriota bacterium]
MWSQTVQADSPVVAIRAGRVLDPADATLSTNQVLLVEEGRITAIGPGLTIPQNARVVDLSTQTVLPGLMDAHTHLCLSVDAKWDLGSFWIVAIQRTPGFRAIQGAAHAREMLESGFTTVRDMGNAGNYLDMDLEKAIRFGIVPGPTIIPAGRIIAPFGGQFWENPADKETIQNPEYTAADTKDEMIRAVRQNIYFGAKVIKIVVDGQRYCYSTEDIRQIVKEAGGAGLKVAAHVQTVRGARAAIEAGVASIEHGWELTDQDLALAKQKHVVLVSTDFPARVLRACGVDEKDAESTHHRFVERLRRAYAAGVSIVFGTDIIVDIPGETRGSLAIEYVDSFVEAGVPAAEILRAMTTRAAVLLGVDDERGRICKGMAADLIAVPGNPLLDIHQLRNIVFVMKEGRIVRTADNRQ